MKFAWAIVSGLIILVFILATVLLFFRPTIVETIEIKRPMAPSTVNEWGEIFKGYPALKYESPRPFQGGALRCTEVFGDGKTWFAQWCEIQRGPTN